jgi:hypothetical protein
MFVHTQHIQAFSFSSSCDSEVQDFKNSRGEIWRIFNQAVLRENRKKKTSRYPSSAHKQWCSYRCRLILFISHVVLLTSNKYLYIKCRILKIAKRQLGRINSALLYDLQVKWRTMVDRRAPGTKLFFLPSNAAVLNYWVFRFCSKQTK